MHILQLIIEQKEIRRGSRNPDTSKMKLFATIVNNSQTLRILAEISMLHVARFLDLLLEIVSSQEHLFQTEIENCCFLSIYKDFLVRKKSNRKLEKLYQFLFTLE